MKATVNGEVRDLVHKPTLADLVVDTGRDPQRPGAAVVRNGEVVPRGRWADTAVGDGDEIEIVAAAQGG